MNNFTDDILRGKTCFIAGGTSGINLGIARRMVELGVKVAILGRNEDRGASALAELQSMGGAGGESALYFSADVRDPGAVTDAIVRATETFGDPLDIVVSGAAGNFLCTAADLSPNGFKAVVDIDLIGTFNVFKAAYSHLRRPGASLIAITAPQGVKPVLLQVHACAAKAGVNMLTQCLALEWGAEGIRVNAISPGPIEDTLGLSKLSTTDTNAAQYKSAIPLGRLGSKDEIADLAVFLASSASAYMTGSIIDCDGGVKLAGLSMSAEE